MSSTNVAIHRGLTAAVSVASALGVAAVAAGPAHASDAVFQLGGTPSLTAQTSDYAFTGSSIHLEGTGWTGPSASVGQCVAIKLGTGSGASGVAAATATKQATPPTPTGSCTGQSAASLDAWALVPAAADGTISADVPFPTAANSTGPAVADADWAAGTTHHLRILGGAVNGGDPRSGYLNFTVAAPATTPTIQPSTPSVNASTGVVTTTLAGSGFPGGEKLTAKLGSTALTFTATRGATPGPTYTVPASGTFSGVTLTLPTGTRAGQYTVDITRDTAGAAPYALPITVNPTVTWSGGVKAGATGTLTLANLANGATVSSVKLGDTTVASGLTADGAGVATASYSIPAGTTPGQVALTIAQTAPAATTYSISTTVYPDETPFGAARFTLKSDTNSPALYQGLYQTSYSDTEHALFATAASGTGTSEDGYLYKLDPVTLDKLASVHPKDVTDLDGVAGRAPYGVGVDDVNGTVWVTNTRTTGVAVYRASDLKLLKQYPASTITHPRDAVYDPKTNRVYVSSASEGATGNGYVSVFEGGDNDGNGKPYEKIKDVQTGPRSDFNPVSLALDNGTLVSPSLSSNKVAVIDTAKSVTSPAATAGTLDDAVKLVEIGAHSTAGNGRGASGIAYDDQDHRIFVASQNDNAVFVADSRTGELLKTVPTGQQTLNVAYDSVHKLAYVTNFGGTSVTVLDKDGNKVAALPITRSNHVAVNHAGEAFVVDKNATGTTNKVWRITPRLETVGGVDVLDPRGTSVTGSADTTPLAITVKAGASAIHVEGTNFRTADGTSGSKIAVKAGSASSSPIVATVDASDDGTWSADVPLPDGWAAGDTGRHLRLLTGALKTGDTARSIAIKVTLEAAAPPADTGGGSPDTGGSGGDAAPVPPATTTTTTPPAAVPAPAQDLAAKIAKAAKQVTATTKKVATYRAAVKAAQKQVATAKKATKKGSKKQRAAAKKRVTALQKRVTAAKKKVATATKQLAKDKRALAGLKAKAKG
ncbi:hypothetical protein [Patulibacter minatonensis]|uniref:hypothetical protein n=1 Tax=Patulibacter minatonensis TaxID=298163 RepID=UPI00047E8626|nr:hypothetical protein [Patulibacter minatonensis]